MININLISKYYFNDILTTIRINKKINVILNLSIVKLLHLIIFSSICFA